MKYILFMSLCVASLLPPALPIKCRLCWPPMDEDDCNESEKVIECRQWESIGYDSCKEVSYPGNHTVARTCYPGYKCDGAMEWCRRYGPCTAECCKTNLCNDGQDEEEEEEESAGNNCLPPVLGVMIASLVAAHVTRQCLGI